MIAGMALAVALLLGVPAGAEAHPLLVGPWSAETPGGPSVYEFGPGEYVGNGSSSNSGCRPSHAFTTGEL